MISAISNAQAAPVLTSAQSRPAAITEASASATPMDTVMISALSHKAASASGDVDHDGDGH